MFVALQETHLSAAIATAEVQMEGYTLHRCDREGGRSHGGVALYTRANLTTRELLKYSNNCVESQVLEVIELQTILVNIYRPPNSPRQLFLEVLERCQAVLDGQPRARSVLVFGDYNFPFIRWPEGSIYTREQEPQLMASEKEQGKRLMEWANENFMEQIVTTATRKESIIDLVFTNTENIVNSYETIINNRFSDHNILKLKLNVAKEEKEDIVKLNPYPNKIYEYDLMKATDEDWIRYNKIIEKEEDKFVKDSENENTDEKLKRLYSILEKTTKLLFEEKEAFKNDEKKETKRRNKIPRAARILMNRKKNISNNIQKCKSGKQMTKLIQKLSLIENEIDESLKKQRVKSENDAISKIKRNPKYFFSYASKFSKLKNTVGPLLNKEDETVKDPEKMAEILRLQYESAFSKSQEQGEEEEVEQEVEVEGEEEEEEVEEEEEEEREDIELKNIVITDNDLREAIEQLSLWSGPGPDGVPGILLKKAKVPIARIMANILQSSLDSSTIPDILKLGFICPILKPGSSREKASSWRPISLTSHVIKTWERVLRKKMVNYLEVNNMMDPNQHGARRNRSCLSQLLEHHDELLKMMEDGANVDVVYSDFEKAFDKVDHEELINKMKTKFNMKGKILKWLQSFLNNRKQQVLIEGRKSKMSKVVSGSIQGSVLGPIMFLMYIQDLSEEITANMKIFVDDAKMKAKVNTEEDVEEMQKNIDKLFDWEDSNKMKCNGAKFQVLRYGKNTEIKEDTCYFSKGMDDVISQFDHLRDLGIILTDDAKFSSHVEKVVKQVRTKVGWMLRTFYTRKKEILKQLWKSLAQCHVDYCSQLYMPANQSHDMAKIEKLFYDFTSKIPEIRQQNYWQRLKSMKMYSQERRMERYRCIYMWKVLEEKVPNCGVKEAPANERLGRRVEVPSLRPGGRAAVHSLQEQTFQINGARLFNILPKNIRNTKYSQDEFKMALDQFLATLPDQPRMGGLVPEALDQVTGRSSNSLLAWGRTRGHGDLTQAL